MCSLKIDVSIQKVDSDVCENFCRSEFQTLEDQYTSINPNP
jgi:hypothetical protein